MENDDAGIESKRAGYGVKLVRGPVLRLPANARHCRSDQEFLNLVNDIRISNPTALFAADLFSGAGGLSLGLEDAGFNVVLGADHFPEAIETHSHHFPGLSVDWDLADADVVERVAGLLVEAKVDLLAGGPPCQPFSKAGRSHIRFQVHHGLREAHDKRRDLWRSFIEVVRLARPPAVLMENVPDMALDKEMFILRAMVQELEDLGYSVEERVIDTWRYGVPQFRQRLILVALRNGTKFSWPAESAERVSVWNAIGELPEVEGGWRPEGGAHGWTDYPGPKTTFQLQMRRGMDTGQEHKVFDHITRPVREDDASAFELMDAKTKYSDLPAEFKRYRDDIFDDKYKRLDEDDLSRTITAHIAKDGYWYIHPRQGRTLTVREAARLQTFPDRYRFAGAPSHAFKQIGNAVPPLLGYHVGSAIIAHLRNPQGEQLSTIEVAETLASWFRLRASLRLSWLRSSTRWQTVSGEMLLDRLEADRVRMVWPVLEMWKTPDATSTAAEALRQIGSLLGREKKVTLLLEMADWLADHLGALEEPDLRNSSIPGLSESVADLAVLVVPVADESSSDEPVLVTKGVLRVASRFLGQPVDRKNKMTDGRLAIARLTGGGPTFRDSHLGLIELAASLCRPIDPVCRECPLAAYCVSSNAEQQYSQQLF